MVWVGARDGLRFLGLGYRLRALRARNLYLKVRDLGGQNVEPRWRLLPPRRSRPERCYAAHLLSGSVFQEEAALLAVEVPYFVIEDKCLVVEALVCLVIEALVCLDNCLVVVPPLQTLQTRPTRAVLCLPPASKCAAVPRRARMYGS